MTSPDNEILTFKEVEGWLHVSERTLRELVSKGKIPHFRVGHQLRFIKQDLVEWAQHGGAAWEDGEYPQ